MSKFIAGLSPKKTVASVTAALQKTINDLLHVEQQNNAQYDNLQKEMARIDADMDAAMQEAEQAAKVRAKLEALLA